MTGGPYFATDAHRRACCPMFYSTSTYAVTCDIVVNQVGCYIPLAAGWLTYEYTQLGSCHAAGGAPAAGVDGGVSAELIPRGKPPNLARRGEIRRGVQPGGIYVYVGTARADSRRSGVGLAPRPQALPSYASCRSGSIYI
jgi:hypothetical protein